jgi:hypothetical protein
VPADCCDQRRRINWLPEYAGSVDGRNGSQYSGHDDDRDAACVHACGELVSHVLTWNERKAEVQQH